MSKIYGAIFLLLCAPVGANANDRLADLSAQMAVITKSALSATSKQMAVKLNLAGKQRMLTQKMVKEALLISLKVNPDDNNKKLQASADLFEKTLVGLQQGDESLGLTKTNYQDVLAQLNKVTALWDAFKPSIEKVIADGDNSEALRLLAQQNVPLLNEMDKAVSLYEDLGDKESSEAYLNDLAVVINLSGKQRMLSQKMLKEALLVAQNIDKAENEKNLQATMQLFDQTLQGLLKGDESLNLVETKDEAILEQLAVVQGHWDTFKPLMEKLDNSVEALQQVSEMNLVLLNDMDKAVKMYEELTKK